MNEAYLIIKMGLYPCCITPLGCPNDLAVFGKNDPFSAGFGGSRLRAEAGLGPNRYRLAPSGITWQVPRTITGQVVELKTMIEGR